MCLPASRHSLSYQILMQGCINNRLVIWLSQMQVISLNFIRHDSKHFLVNHLIIWRHDHCLILLCYWQNFSRKICPLHMIFKKCLLCLFFSLLNLHDLVFKCFYLLHQFLGRLSIVWLVVFIRLDHFQKNGFVSICKFTVGELMDWGSKVVDPLLNKDSWELFVTHGVVNIGKGEEFE